MAILFMRYAILICIYICKYDTIKSESLRNEIYVKTYF